MIQCSKITEPCEKLCSIMSYDDSIDGFGKTGLSVRESASLLGRKPNSISKSRKHEEVLDCLGASPRCRLSCLSSMFKSARFSHE